MKIEGIKTITFGDGRVLRVLSATITALDGAMEKAIEVIDDATEAQRTLEDAMLAPALEGICPWHMEPLQATFIWSTCEDCRAERQQPFRVVSDGAHLKVEYV